MKYKTHSLTFGKLPAGVTFSDPDWASKMVFTEHLVDLPVLHCEVCKEEVECPDDIRHHQLNMALGNNFVVCSTCIAETPTEASRDATASLSVRINPVRP